MITSEQLRTMLQHRYDPLDVVVRTARSGMGGNAMVGVAQAVAGADWHKWCLILVPERPIVEINVPTVPLKDIGRQSLANIRKIHPHYVPRSHDDSWIDGFKHGCRQWITDDPK